MTAAQWATLIPGIAGVLSGLAAWLHAQAAHSRIDKLPAGEDKTTP